MFYAVLGQKLLQLFLFLHTTKKENTNPTNLKSFSFLGFQTKLLS